MAGKYTLEQVSVAANDAADMVRDELSLGERDSDVLNLAVHAFLAVLVNPRVNFDRVISSNYAEPPGEVRSWWSNWS